MDTRLLLLFIIFISLVIADYFLTDEGVIKRRHPERMSYRKELMTKYGNKKGNMLSSLIIAGIGIFILIFSSTMEYYIPVIPLAGIIVFIILAGCLLFFVIIDAKQLLKGK